MPNWKASFLTEKIITSICFSITALCTGFAIELKLGEFEPEYKGQIELYLRWLSKYEKAEGEEEPIALIAVQCVQQILAHRELGLSSRMKLRWVEDKHLAFLEFHHRKVWRN